MQQSLFHNIPELYYPRCPMCGEYVPLLGQYSPVMPHSICRECSLEYPLPVEVFITGGKDRLGIKINPDVDLETRTKRMALELMVRRAATDDQRQVVKWNISGLVLRNGVRLSRMEQYTRWTRQALNGLRIERENGTQLEIPFCNACGCVHDNRFSGGTYRTLCQPCEDKARVNSLWKNKGIFGGDDSEGILDRLNTAFPDLFERGVLPDYWFHLMAQEAQRHEARNEEAKT